MSRRPEDWVLDTIVHPWLGDFFTLEDALEVASDGYALLGTSPRILQDWRWYKDPSALDENTALTSAISSYRRNIHSLLDTRFTGQARLDDLENSSLIGVSSKIAIRLPDKMNGKDSYEVVEFAKDVERLLETAGALHPQTLQSLQGLVDWSVSPTKTPTVCASIFPQRNRPQHLPWSISRRRR